MNTLIIHTDGGARGNPGPSGIGAVFWERDVAGSLHKVHEIARYIGEQTNNYAEYSALIAALAWAGEAGYDSVACYLDSELVVKQVTGQYKVKEPTLKPLVAQVLAAKGAFKKVTFTHVRREKNKEADALVNRALDEATGKPGTT
jgi:ribonuclease HI